MEVLKKSIIKDINQLGITNIKELIYNPSYDDLFKYELSSELVGFEKGQLTELDTVNVMTGKFTGRSPKDKYIVKDAITENTVWWTSDQAKNDNKPISQEVWTNLKDLVIKELSNKKLFVIDAFCGANEDTRLKVRFIMEVAWQAHFVKNMFLRPTEEELANYGEPDFVVMNGSKTSDPNFKEHGTNSETFIAFNLTEKMQVIGGSWYGGEMKKGIFTLDDFKKQLSQIKKLGPLQKVMGMIPGMSAMSEAMEDVDPEQDLKRLFGIIDSMTGAERENPTKVVDQSRRRRIAAGAGVEPHEVNELVKQFDVMSQMMTQMAGKGMRERMKMVREMQNSAMDGGQLSRTKASTGKRMSPKERAKAKKMREKELRKRKRLAKQQQQKPQ